MRWQSNVHQSEEGGNLAFTFYPQMKWKTY